MAVAPGFGLFDEAEPASVGSCGFGVGGLVTRVDDDRDFFDAGRECFFNHHAQGTAGDAILTHQCLQR